MTASLNGLDCDIAIAGAGISGVFAAIATGRMGAKTVLIERFGSLGGNIGPGMIWGGSLDGEADYTLPGGMAGIPKEFMARLGAMMGDTRANFANISGTCSHLAYQMTQEAGVELMLSAFAGDPIVENGVVRGLLVETVSGKVEVRAAATIDATGTASLAARAGAPIFHHCPPDPSYAPIVRPRYLEERYQKYNEVGLVVLIADVDYPEYEAFLGRGYEPSEEEQQWARENLLPSSSPMLPVLRQALENGDFEPSRELLPNVHLVTSLRIDDYGRGLSAMRFQARGELDVGDWRQVSVIEAEMRAAAHEFLQVHRDHVPGFARAYMAAMSPFVGARGGPSIDAEHVLTVEESIKGSRHDDVLYVNIHEAEHGGAKEGYDFPYRSLLPKGLDGLLVTGRGAGYEQRAHDPSGIRARPSMMVLGQATGVAAAVAVQRDETPRNVNVRQIQSELVKQGLFLGDEQRLKGLGLA